MSTKSWTTVALAAALALLAACDSHEAGAPAADAADEQAGKAAAAAAASGVAGGAVQGAGATAQPEQKPGEVRRISIDEARKAVADGTAVIYDVRGEAAYDSGHIAGAKPLPGNEVDQRLAELPKDKLIITYCA